MPGPLNACRMSQRQRLQRVAFWVAGSSCSLAWLLEACDAGEEGLCRHCCCCQSLAPVNKAEEGMRMHAGGLIKACLCPAWEHVLLPTAPWAQCTVT